MRVFSKPSLLFAPLPNPLSLERALSEQHCKFNQIFVTKVLATIFQMLEVQSMPYQQIAAMAGN
jgi:hypothetical protein